MTILISGATGTTGTAVCRELLAAGLPVRAMTRSTTSAERLRDEDVDAVVADLADPESLAGAVDGVDAIYMATTNTPALAEQEGNLASAAAAVGVRIIVKCSVVGAAAGSPLEFARLHFAAEEAVRSAGVPTTVIRPNGFMQNTLAWADQIPAGTIYAPIMDARWSIVDARDIAAVAVAALQDPERHAGHTYTVTGPEATSPREQIAILSELLGLTLEAHEVPIEPAKQSMLATGWPAWSVDRMGELFELYAKGFAEAVSDDVERVTSQLARTYRQFAEDHRAAFGA